MIYLDNGATSFPKAPPVAQAMTRALQTCTNPGRGGYRTSMAAAITVLRCRVQASAMFGCEPEQVVFTSNCTHGLNMAIRTLVKPGRRVVISGFEHNAVLRPLIALKAEIVVAGEELFNSADTLEKWEAALRKGVDAAIFTHVSNVFGYILPVEEMAALCRQYGVPFVVDAAQSAGTLPIDLKKWGAEFVAMPGHKGLLGPQGTGLLLCNRLPEPLLYGGTGTQSKDPNMPEFLPDRGEAGTLNVPGVAGLEAALAYLSKTDISRIHKREMTQARRCIQGLEKMGYQVFYGTSQIATISFVPPMDCEELSNELAKRNIAVRAGLHCAPLAHKSAGTLATGTVRISFGKDACDWQTNTLLEALGNVKKL